MDWSHVITEIGPNYLNQDVRNYPAFYSALTFHRLSVYSVGRRSAPYSEVVFSKNMIRCPLAQIDLLVTEPPTTAEFQKLQ
jgi:hypothetical protein